jgi:hypothetical protein
MNWRTEMSNHHDPHRPETGDVDPGLTIGGEPFDDVADRAGRELRRPAPRDGIDQVRRSYRRRRATTAVAGGAAAVLLVGGGFWLGTRDDEPTFTDTPPISTTDGTVGSTAVTPSSVTGQAPTTDQPPSTQPTATDTESTAPPTATTDPAVEQPAPPEPAVSDEVLPDPLAFAADGFERELVGRDLVVRSTPEQLIPLDLPEPEIYFYGVGPNGVAYLRLDGPEGTRVVAVPTSGPNTGAVYEIIAPYTHDGPWLGFMTPTGIDTWDNSSERRAPYVDIDGQPLSPPDDPTFTWRLEYRYDAADPSTTRAAVVELATGAEFEVPDSEPVREGQFTAEVRPLPDGRVTVRVLSADGIAVVWALTPATGLWTQHPDG